MRTPAFLRAACSRRSLATYIAVLTLPLIVRAQGTVLMRAQLNGSRQGPLFPSSCNVERAFPGQPVASFSDITGAAAPAGVATFALDLPTTCVAPALSALFDHEPVTGTITLYQVTPNGPVTPTLTYTLAHAALARVWYSVEDTTPQHRYNVHIELVSPAWTVGTPTTGSQSADTWTKTSPAAAGGATSAHAVAHSALPATMTAASGSSRPGIRSFTASPSDVMAMARSNNAVAPVPTYGAPVAVALVGSQTTFPPEDSRTPTTTFISFGVQLDAHATLDPHGDAAGTTSITLAPIRKKVGPATTSLQTAGQHRESLRSATIGVYAADANGAAHQALTITAHNAILAGDAIASSTNTGQHDANGNELVTVAISGVTVTDTKTGRTAVSSP